MYLYFLKNETTGLTKVGSSANPRLRMKNIKYDNRKKYFFHTMKPLYIAQIKGREVEEKAHQIMKSKCVEGEWFSITEKDINAVCRILQLKKMILS